MNFPDSLGTSQTEDIVIAFERDWGCGEKIPSEILLGQPLFLQFGAGRTVQDQDPFCQSFQQQIHIFMFHSDLQLISALHENCFFPVIYHFFGFFPE